MSEKDTSKPVDKAPDTKAATPDNGRSGPDNLTQDELAAHRGDDYAYLDQTRQRDDGPFHGGDISQADLNPAYYPANVKSDALHGEDEKAGADYPTGPRPGDVEDQSRKAEDIPGVKEEQERQERLDVAAAAARPARG